MFIQMFLWALISKIPVIISSLSIVIVILTVGRIYPLVTLPEAVLTLTSLGVVDLAIVSN